MCEGNVGADLGQQGAAPEEWSWPTPSPLTVPGPTPPLATLFSHHNSLEAIFLWVGRGNQQENPKLQRGDQVGETRLDAVSLLPASVSFKPPILSSRGFQSSALISLPTSPVSFPPFIPSCLSSTSAPCPTLGSPHAALVDGCPLGDPGQALT